MKNINGQKERRDQQTDAQREGGVRALDRSIAGDAVYRGVSRGINRTRPPHLENPVEYQKWAVELGFASEATTPLDWLEAWEQAFEDWSES